MIENATPINTTTSPLPPSHFSDTNEQTPPDVAPGPSQMGFDESSHTNVAKLAALLMRMFGYVTPDGRREICSRPVIYFTMSGEQVDATCDLCIRDTETSDYLLLFLENKTDISGSDTEPQLTAMAIAVFHQNNVNRRSRGQPELESNNIPAFTMSGSAPIFYSITVTKALVDAVAHGTFPEERTVVKKYIPEVPDPESYFEVGMRQLANRLIIFKSFAALKSILCISKYFEDYMRCGPPLLE